MASAGTTAGTSSAIEKAAAPGYVDIQVNGYAGVDFLSAGVTAATLQHAADKLRAGGVTTILPTITTASISDMVARLTTMRTIIDADADLRSLMPAFHIEGPCISPEAGYRGAHDPASIRPATREVFKPLIDAAGGIDRVAMVTLAPEVDAGLAVTRWLVKQGVVLAIGHTNAPMEVLRDAEQAGVSLFTHFGNGCSHDVDRHHNVLNRVMSLEKIKVSLIVDGHHLPWFLLKNWIRYFGVERCLLTTDCVSPADAPPGRYTVGSWNVEVGENRRVQPAGQPMLAGSALTMREGHANLVQHVGLSEADAMRMAIDQPAALISRWIRSEA